MSYADLKEQMAQASELDRLREENAALRRALAQDRSERILAAGRALMNASWWDDQRRSALLNQSSELNRYLYGPYSLSQRF